MDLHDFEDVAENYDNYIDAFRVPDEDLINFHLELAELYGGAGIVDIACGTGVTLIPLIKEGYKVIGVDISKPMLNVLKRKREKLPVNIQRNASLIHANMTDFKLVKPCSLAVIPRSGFMHLLLEADQERAFTSIYRNLTQEGILSFNTFDPNYELIANNLKGTDPSLVFRCEYTNFIGNKEKIWERVCFDPENQVLSGVWTFEEMNAQGKIINTRERPLKMRWSFEPEIRYLLRICGFEVINIYSSYKKEPRKYGEYLVWIVRKKIQ